MDTPAVGTPSFGEDHFGEAQLGDVRRTQRLVRLADAFLAHPGGTLPDKCGSPAMYPGLMQLVDATPVTHEAVLEPHTARTLRLRRGWEATALLLFALTELDFTSRASLADQLGASGDGHGKGSECFNGLAVRADTRAALGLAYRELFRRAEVPKGATKAQSRARLSRQSRLWKRGPAAVPPAPPGRRGVVVTDAEGDPTEALEALHHDGKRFGVRSQGDRRIHVGHGPQAAGKLDDHARSLPARSFREVDGGERPGRPARRARCAVSWAAVELLPPRQGRGEHGPAPLRGGVVRCGEVDAPVGVEPLEWILLTDVPVADAAAALERVSWDEARGVIEEFHKAQKTGCGIEDPQFTRTERLEPVLALLSVVAVQLLRLRDLARSPETANRPAAAEFGERGVRVLSAKRYGEARSLTMAEFLRALARRGGHQNRRHDGPPGWLVLWRGWMKLQAMVEGALTVRCHEM
jgi:hypothetical protein